MQNFVALLVIGLNSSQTPLSLDNAVDSALGHATLSRQTARFDPGLMRLFRQGEFALPLFETAIENPWRLPFVADVYQKQLVATQGKPAETLALGGRMLGQGVRRSLLGNPIQAAETAAKQPGSLKKALAQMKEKGLLKNVPTDLSQIPEATAQAAALILDVAMDAIQFRRAAFAKVPKLQTEHLRLIRTATSEEDTENAARNLELYRNVDLKPLLAGAEDLLTAIATAESWVREVPAEKVYALAISTEWGDIVLSGGKDHRYPEKPYLLILDTGGNDTYFNSSANQSFTNWLSITLDTNGHDYYFSSETLQQSSIAQWGGRKAERGKMGPCSALMGYSFLVDGNGDDLYRTARAALGSARLGCAYLWDKGGDDRYESYADSEGFALFGLGILEDAGGKDYYLCLTTSQGHGQTLGFGLLIDRQGDDVYLASNEVLDFPSPQTKEHNASLAQGVGYGRRADYLDGHSLSGGIGALFDLAGNDSYTCGVFGQGVGYWEGMGFLWDLAGTDRYTGQWYVQGASAHFAIGYLEDGTGDDQYHASLNMAQGAGHDFGFGMLLEREGNDRYQAPNLSLGGGNANGMGMFFELHGKDRYESKGLTLGKAADGTRASLRERALCLGLFLDMEGEDAYPESAPWAKNGAKALNGTIQGTATESQLGVFFDQ